MQPFSTPLLCFVYDQRCISEKSMRFDQTDILYEENGKKNSYKGMRKNLSLNLFMQDIKLRKSLVESVFVIISLT